MTSLDFDIKEYSLTDEELVYVERLLETIKDAKDFGEKDMSECRLQSFLKEKTNE
jgi:hypothetical protein